MLKFYRHREFEEFQSTQQSQETTLTATEDPNRTAPSDATLDAEATLTATEQGPDTSAESDKFYDFLSTSTPCISKGKINEQMPYLNKRRKLDLIDEISDTSEE